MLEFFSVLLESVFWLFVSYLTFAVFHYFAVLCLLKNAPKWLFLLILNIFPILTILVL